MGFPLSAEATRAVFPLTPLPAVIDITSSIATGSPVGVISEAEANAFFHLHAAKRTLDVFGTPQSSRPISLRIHEWTPPGSRSEAGYVPYWNRIELFVPRGSSFTVPSSITPASSGTIIAHEYAHRVVQDVYAGSPLAARVHEGLCDSMGSLVTGHARIAVGVIPSPRDISARPASQFSALSGDK